MGRGQIQEDGEKGKYLLTPYDPPSFINSEYIGVSKHRGTPKWMVKIMENHIKMDDLGGPPLYLETPTSSLGPFSFFPGYTTST